MQKAFEKIIERFKEEAENRVRMHDWQGRNAYENAIEIVNQVAEDYKNPSVTAWETIYRRLLEVTDEYAEVGDIVNVTDCKKLSNLLRHYKEQLTEEADSTSFNGWIPCSKELPKESGHYIVSCSTGYGLQISRIKYLAKYKRWELIGKTAYWRVDAWMLLPEPYQPKVCINTECCYNQNAECPASEGRGGFEEKTS